MRRTCVNMVYELAKRDERVVFIGSDLGAGLLDDMKAEMPDRFFMEGICEQNMIGMAAGMAREGYIPYVNTIATFMTRRCFEQVAVDVCLQNLPVRLIANGGGLVYAPLGPTHTAVDDISLMRSLPGMTVVAPVDAEEMRRFMAQTVEHPHPMYIRLGKGGDPVVSADAPAFEIGRAIAHRDGADVLIVSTGVMTERALRTADLLAKKGIGCGVLHMHTVKPIDTAQLIDGAGKVALLVTLEEHNKVGGLGSAVCDALDEHAAGVRPDVLRLALPDAYPEDYGSQDSLLEHYGLQPPAVAASIAARLSR